LEVVDALGNIITTLVNEYKTIGTYTANWNGNDQSGRVIPAGGYTVRLVSGSGSTTYPVVIVR
jgi:flagellar hook assembly protein FlgD